MYEYETLDGFDEPVGFDEDQDEIEQIIEEELGA